MKIKSYIPIIVFLLIQTITAQAQNKSLVFLAIGAQQVNNAVRVNWAAASELNVDHYTVERSENGIDFSLVEEQSGTGNSSTRKDYYCLDEQALEGLSYYRIRQTDNDGGMLISEIVAVNYKGSGLNLIYPNPSEDSRIHFTILNDQTQMTILSRRGKEAFTKFYEERGEVFEDLASKLEPGIYFVQFRSPENTAVQKLMIR
jgi:hypothetical protein